MAWILVLYWTLNGEIVLNLKSFSNAAACEARIEPMRQVFEDGSPRAARCQAGKQP